MEFNHKYKTYRSEDGEGFFVFEQVRVEHINGPLHELLDELFAFDEEHSDSRVVFEDAPWNRGYSETEMELSGWTLTDATRDLRKAYSAHVAREEKKVAAEKAARAKVRAAKRKAKAEAKAEAEAAERAEYERLRAKFDN